MHGKNRKTTLADPCSPSTFSPVILFSCVLPSLYTILLPQEKSYFLPPSRLDFLSLWPDINESSLASALPSWGGWALGASWTGEVAASIAGLHMTRSLSGRSSWWSRPGFSPWRHHRLASCEEGIFPPLTLISLCSFQNCIPRLILLRSLGHHLGLAYVVSHSASWESFQCSQLGSAVSRFMLVIWDSLLIPTFLV